MDTEAGISLVSKLRARSMWEMTVVVIGRPSDGQCNEDETPSYLPLSVLIQKTRSWD